MYWSILLFTKIQNSSAKTIINTVIVFDQN